MDSCCYGCAGLSRVRRLTASLDLCRCGLRLRPTISRTLERRQRGRCAVDEDWNRRILSKTPKHGLRDLDEAVVTSMRYDVAISKSSSMSASESSSAQSDGTGSWPGEVSQSPTECALMPTQKPGIRSWKNPLKWSGANWMTSPAETAQRVLQAHGSLASRRYGFRRWFAHLSSIGHDALRTASGTVCLLRGLSAMGGSGRLQPGKTFVCQRFAFAIAKARGLLTSQLSQ